MDKKQQINTWYIVVAIALWLAFQSWYTTWRSVEPIPYSQFSQLLKDGKVTDIGVGPGQIVGKFKQALPDGRTAFTTNRVDPALADELSRHGVTYNGTVENTFLTAILSWVVPVLFFFAIWSFFIRRISAKQGFGGLMSIGKSKAKVYVETDTKVALSSLMRSMPPVDPKPTARVRSRRCVTVSAWHATTIKRRLSAPVTTAAASCY